MKLSRAIAGAAFHLALAGHGAAADFTFGALGDAPYSRAEASAFRGVIARMNHEPLAFVVHVGDFKNGHGDCGDEVYRRRKEWFDDSDHPFIFTPGDNDWTDCWRSSAGAFDTRERLARLRELFFAQPSSLGRRPLPVTRQADADPAHPYPEHLRWTYEGVLFVTLNVPGSYNNFTRDRAEFRMRDAAVRAWMTDAFRLARERRLAGVVLMMQADPWAVAGPLRHVYAPLLDTLAAETIAFRGEVVLIHGDTHRFRFDHPLLAPRTRRRIANFTRIEVFGSPEVNWVRVNVRDAGGKLTITATPGGS